MAECRSESMEVRLERLEAANRSLEASYRRWQRAGVVAMAVLGVTLIAGANAIPRLVEAEQFVLRDQTGRMRAALGVRADGTPGLGLFDEQGRPRLSIDLNPAGDARLSLMDAAGQPQAAMAIRPDGTPGLGLFDSAGTARLSLDIDAAGRPGANLNGDDGILRAALAIRPDGTPGLGLFDEQGKPCTGVEAQPQAAAARPEPRVH